MKAIEIIGLSKRHTIGGPNLWQRTRDEIFSFSKKKQGKEIWTLRDISFNVEEGQILGIVGTNGAGKSTLLKILSRITDPTEGKAVVRGRVSSLLEVGTGFHSELTGRENVYLKGSMLGMGRKEISQHFEAIVDFAGVEAFIDQPIKKYSSGMKVRLGFSVAAHLQAEVIFIDEVLAVGDAAFQEKCMTKMHEVSRSGRTVLLVSHNMNAIRRLSTRCLWLHNGMIKGLGDPTEVIHNYLQSNRVQESGSLNSATLEAATERIIAGEAHIYITALLVAGTDGVARDSFRSDEEVQIRIGFRLEHPVHDLRLMLSLTDDENRAILTTQLSDGSVSTNFQYMDSGSYEASCVIPANLLGDNAYFISLQCIQPSIEHLVLRRAASFRVRFREDAGALIGSFGEAYFRPMLPWRLEPLQIKETEACL